MYRVLTRVEKGNIIGYIPSIVVRELSHHIIMSELIERGHGKRVSDCISIFKRNPGIINEIQKSWDLINGIFLINCSILYENEEILKNALVIAKKFQLLINDANIVAFAQSNQIAHLASNDKDFCRVNDLTIWKPYGKNILNTASSEQ